ncbi:hypothetical protein [Actinomadura violacea]|uniref:Uncharacterized protein n=1 Tax=Actinomadura violacea TaxID=2819934 RepID=A0ABS3S4X9_9ACTN|nr:hypothetical protein [Actinomadura violacea]MBO2463628.1 hypothetical protein [Actinomadura violacea]
MPVPRLRDIPGIGVDEVGDAADDADSYLPFQGRGSLLEAAAAHVGRIAGRAYDPATECVSVAGGLRIGRPSPAPSNGTTLG